MVCTSQDQFESNEDAFFKSDGLLQNINEWFVQYFVFVTCAWKRNGQFGHIWMKLDIE